MIRIVSRKVPIKNAAAVRVYLRSLTEKVKSQPGFITSVIFQCRDTDNIFSMTDWESENHWKVWKDSVHRKKIQRDFKCDVQEEHYHTFHHIKTEK